MDVLVEIDSIPFGTVSDSEMSCGLGSCGPIWGCDGMVNDQNLMVYTPTQKLFSLRAESFDKQKVVEGLFKRGEFAEVDGKKVYRVWERVI